MAGRLFFQDVDDFAEALCGMDGRFIPTARPTSNWWVETQRFHRSSLQTYQIGSAATFAGQGPANAFTCALPLTDPTQIRIDGSFLEPDGFLVVREDQPFTFACHDVTRWAGINLPIETGLVAPELIDAQLSGDSPRLRTALPHLDRLRWVVERAIAANVECIEPASSQAMEEEVALCLSMVLTRAMRGSDRHIGRPQVSRTRTIARTLALMEASEGKMLFIDDLCRATQVSERTLRNIFYEYFGVGPMRLLKVRQLREVRAALLKANPHRETVTRIAARFGVWDFSLFTRNYKALFGESPSRTLRTPPTDVKVRSTLSWLHYASRIFIDDIVRPESPAAEKHDSQSSCSPAGSDVH